MQQHSNEDIMFVLLCVEGEQACLLIPKDRYDLASVDPECAMEAAPQSRQQVVLLPLRVEEPEFADHRKRQHK